jgi:hypothetical protein
MDKDSVDKFLDSLSDDELKEKWNKYNKHSEQKNSVTISEFIENIKQEIVGYRLKSHIDRNMVDGILKNSMPIWNDEDKSVYFIKGHVAGSLVLKMKELQVLDLWFTPIYESEEVKSDWAKAHHLEYYYKEGVMANKSKQETLTYSEAAKKEERIFNSNIVIKETLEEAAEKYSREVWGPYYDDIHSDPAITLTLGELSVKDFSRGAKWQAERMYSEEEVIRFLQKYRFDLSSGKTPNIGDTAKEWFVQFKKKYR